ncbi:conserved hypothetical protein [Ricinus communis]|uniref:Histidine kinase/HSP90-like ATPase domain-containing protein n=1 Tax=Ricinus communis TaxID=3988 RepID=B9TME1_RICCO|nr:conserved hypothetical protein [Ricinus communis]
MKIDRVKNPLTETDPSREELEKALNFAEAVADEGRQQVFTLRSQEAFGGDVYVAVQSHTRELAEQYGMSFKVCAEGRQRLLKPEIAEQVCAIIREALNNACRHSGSDVVLVELCYGRASFVARIVDRGCGIAPEILAAGGKRGHWGMAGMRERAQQIGGTLSVSACKSGGTEVCLNTPASVAYPLLLRAA